MKHLFTKRFNLLLALSLFSVVTFAESNKNYKSTAVAKVATTGAGTVYVQAPSGGTSGSWGTTSTATYTQKTSSAPTHKYTYQYKNNTGYSWQGWYDKETGGTQQSTANSYQVGVEASENGNTKTLYARWTANTYYVVFSAEDATEGEMAKQTFTYDKAQKLSANQFGRKYTVTYDPAGGQCDKESDEAVFTFANWIDDNKKTYADEAEVKNLSETNNAEFKLYAVWQDGSVVLPEPTKEGCLFDGWFYSAAQVGVAGTQFTPNENLTLTAHWTVAPAQLTTIPAAIEGLVYTGEAQTLITAGEAYNGTVLYSLDGENYSEELPQGKDAKTYTVYYKVEPVEGGTGIDATTLEVTIAKAAAVVTTAAEAKELAYTGEDQALVTAGEADGGEMQYSLDGENYATTIPTGKEIGDYTVYYQVVADANHNDVSAQTITVTIAKPRAELTMAPTAVADLAYDGNTHTLINAGEAQGGELQYSLDGETFATTLPEATNAGTYSVYYMVVGDENHSDLTLDPIEVSIAKVALTITAEDKQTAYGSEAPAFTVAYQGFIGEETEAVLGGELAFACEYAVGSNAGEYAITPSGLTAVNYEITFNNGKLTVAKVALTITAEDKDTIYGTPAPEFTVAYQGFIGEETEAELGGELAFACEYTIGFNADEYAITPSGLTSDNYDITFVDGKLTVAKAPLSVTAENKQTTYGAEAPAFTVTYEGFFGEDYTDELDGELTFACEYEAGSNAGEYDITPSGLTAVNYDITFVDGKLTVAKVTLNVTADDKQTTYGSEAPEFTATIEGVTGNDNVEEMADELIYGCTYEVGSNIGEYTIITSGIPEDYEINYDINYFSGTLTVTKAEVVLTAPAAIENLTYTGEPQQLITAGEAVGGELQYSQNGEDFSTTIPTATEIGSYTVFYRVVADANHIDVAATSIEARIAAGKAQVSVEPVAAEGLEYTGEEQTLIIAGETQEGTLVYSLDGITFAQTLPVATNAGEYTVYYRVQGDDSHSDSDIQTVDASIAKAAQTIVWEQELTTLEVGQFIQLQAEATLTVTFTSSDEQIAYIDEENNLRAVKEGVVTITAVQEGDDNHFAAEPVQKELTVTPTTISSVEDSRNQVKVTKIIRNNQVLIIRDGKTYNAAGLLVE